MEINARLSWLGFVTWPDKHTTNIICNNHLIWLWKSVNIAPYQTLLPFQLKALYCSDFDHTLRHSLWLADHRIVGHQVRSHWLLKRVGCFLFDYCLTMDNFISPVGKPVSSHSKRKPPAANVWLKRNVNGKFRNTGFRIFCCFELTTLSVHTATCVDWNRRKRL